VRIGEGEKVCEVSGKMKWQERGGALDEGEAHAPFQR
jgi:hypothetical protein